MYLETRPFSASHYSPQCALHGEKAKWRFTKHGYVFFNIPIKYLSILKDTVCFYYMMMTTLFMILFLNFPLVDFVLIDQDLHVVVTVLLDTIQILLIL